MNNQEMMQLLPELDSQYEELVQYCKKSGTIDQSLYMEYDVKRGLRDSNGKGVLTGLTEISDVVAFDIIDGEPVPCDGRLYFQGQNVNNLVRKAHNRRFLFEETTYLLLFGSLPTEHQLKQFINILGGLRELSGQFVRDVIMKAPSANIMNALEKSIVTLYSYDENPEDISVENVLRQSLQLISKVPVISVFAYQSYMHFKKNDVLIIRNPDPECSTAENILRMLRPDGKYTELEAKVLDVALVLHAEHGGGNNSTFTTHVVTSSGTDTYSTIASSIASLKGPKHGGANLKVQKMIEDIKCHVTDWEDEKALTGYLQKILDKQAFDNAGLIYGIGHAVYSESDPRAGLLMDCAASLAAEKGYEDDYVLYSLVARLAPEIIAKKRKMYKGVSANVDFYSGLIYRMLDLPCELYAPIFAMARIAGWSAHRLEELQNAGKIIRPAYIGVKPVQEYVPIENR